MKREYAEWIAAEVPANPIGLCAAVTATMAEQFPELKRVRGHYYCHAWGNRAHWWLVTEQGEIVDPTAAQFPSGGLGLYEEYAEGSPEPSGKCAGCGGYVYGGGSFCSGECEAATMQDMGLVRDGAVWRTPAQKRA